jgi:hypothetical protein
MLIGGLSCASHQVRKLSNARPQPHRLCSLVGPYSTSETIGSKLLPLLIASYLVAKAVVTVGPSSGAREMLSLASGRLWEYNTARQHKDLFGEVSSTTSGIIPKFCLTTSGVSSPFHRLQGESH